MKNLYQKLFKVQGLSMKKDAENPFFKSSYITLDQIVNTLSPLLEENNMLVLHRTENKEVVTSILDIESGEAIESRFPLIESNDPQKIGSCITYAKRYNLGQLFNIITDKDDDGNKAAELPWYTDGEFNKLTASGKIDKLTTSVVMKRLREMYKVASKYEAMFDDYFKNLK
jgi:hypothetical protein